MTKIKDRDKILKATRGKWQHTRGLPSVDQRIPQQKLYKPEGNSMIYLSWQKGRTYNQKTLYPERLSFRFDGEIKRFPVKQKLREVSTTKSALQQMLKELNTCAQETHEEEKTCRK